MMSDDQDDTMMGQPLTRAQPGQIAKGHDMTLDLAKQMVEQCHQMMEHAEAEEAHPQ